MRMKKLFTILALLVSAASGWAQEVVIDKIHYSLYDNDGVTEAFVSGYDENIVEANILANVTIEGVEYAVTRMYLPNCKHISIPRTITEIEIFASFANIETLTIDPENPVYDSRDNCNAIIRTESNSTVLVLPCSILPNSLKTISRISVWGRYQNFIVPDGVESIEDCAFNYAWYEPGVIENISISKSVKNIGGNPWWWSVANVSIDEDNPYYYSQDNCVIEKATKKLIATGSNATIPSDIQAFGVSSLYGWAVNGENNLEFDNEIPFRFTEGRGYLAENSISLIVPEGMIPRYLFQGWCNGAFKTVTDGTSTFYCQLDWGGDTWSVPYIDVVTAKPGDEVTLSVKIWSEQLVGFQFDLYLPDGIEVTTDEDDYEDIYLSTERTTERRHIFTSQQQSDGSWRILCYSNNNNTFEGEEGEVCTIKVKVSENLAENGYPIEIRNAVTTYLNEGTPAQEVRSKITSYINLFEPESVLLGDANGDGTVNVTDIATIVSYIMGNNPTKFVFVLADAYTDGAINVTDIAATVGIIMNESAPQQAPRRNARRAARQQTAEATTARLEVIPFAIEPGEEKEVEVVLYNPDDAFTGMQFDLALPEGISLVSDEDGYLVYLGSRTTSRKHSIEAQQRTDGTIRVMAYSSRNSNFSGTEGDVAILTLKADDQLEAGVYDLQLRSIVLSQANGGDISQQEPDDYEASVLSGTIAGNPVIKGDITAEAANIISSAMADDATSIDLTKAVAVAEEASFSAANPNMLIFLSEGKTIADTKNVVIGDACANLELTDAKPFDAPKPFSAASVSLNRSFSAGWNTVVLPFAINDLGIFGQDVKAYELNDYNDNEGTLSFSTAATFNAAQPYVVYVGTPSNSIITLSDASICPVQNGKEDIQTAVSGVTFQGTYAPIAAPSMGGKYGVTAQGRIQKGSDNASIRSFRAYFELSDGAEIKAINFDGEQATGIEMADAADDVSPIYDISGRRVNARQKGLIIVKGQKKLVK